MKKIATIGLLALAAIGGGWLAAHEARAAGEWSSLGGVNGAEVFKLTDGPRTCYLSTPSGSISCTR